jgi:hypothetical protein
LIGNSRIVFTDKNFAMHQDDNRISHLFVS